MALTASAAPATAALRACFAEFGLPRVIRTDNGVPFGAPLALGGLSPLAVWWIRLGIRPERIQKGVPQQNGTHERMHRTLKAEATRPASASLPAQQQRFDRWRRTFNDRRPHEALANTPPAQHYTPSPRVLPRRLPILEYLFSSRQNADENSTLFVFIRPVILRDDKFADLKFLSEQDVQAAEVPPDLPASEPMTMR